MTRFVCIKPLESYLFRLHGEFDVNLKGPYSTAMSWDMPLPSTIAGILSTIRIENGKVQIDYNSKNFDEKYTLSGQLWGPIVIKNGKIGPLNGEYVNGELIIRSGEVKKERRIGIGIEENMRITKEGMIYSATFVDLDVDEICYRYDNFEGKSIVKFGGEGRVALIESKDIDFRCEKSKLAYLLSPLLFDKEIVVDQETNEIKIPDLGVRIKRGRVYSVGLGFNVRLNKRKPIYKALMPGSIIIADKEIECFQSMGLFSELGYGSLLPTKKIRIE